MIGTSDGNTYKDQVANALSVHNLETATVVKVKQDWPHQDQIFSLVFDSGDRVYVPERFIEGE